MQIHVTWHSLSSRATALEHFNAGVSADEMRAHLPLSPVILYSVWFFSPSISEPKPPRPCRGAEHAQTHWYGWVDWIQFGVGLHRLWPKFISILLLSLQAVSDFFQRQCIILACANANGPQKLRRIYADMKGYRLVQIWLVIVSDFGFSCKVSCKRINLVAKVHAHPPEDFCSHGNCMLAVVT